MNSQVDKEHYDFRNYSHESRWVSYFYQIKTVLDLDPETVLEIGVGDKVFGEYLKNNTSIKYTSLDIANDLKPDIVGSVTKIPLEKDSYDLAVAFEVLEHLPYSEFKIALRELSRISKKYIVISLPHFGPRAQLFLKLPLIKEIKLAKKISFRRKHVFDGEHYWEIGKRGYSLKKIKKDISREFTIIRDFVPFWSQYHHFFILEKK